MREIIATNFNIMMIQNDDDSWIPSAEVVIITNEPRHHLDEDFQLKVRRRECEQFRFLASERSISDLINGLEKVRFAIQSQTSAAESANAERKKAV